MNSSKIVTLSSSYDNSFRIHLVILLFLVTFGTYCSSDSGQSNSNSEITQSVESKLDEAGLSDLYQYYTSNPVTQQQKDENEIIDWLADQKIVAERVGSGIYIQILDPGNGPAVKRSDVAVTHYEGSLLNGKIFDSSIQKGRPLTMPVYQGITGWQEALTQLNEGGKCLVLIPSTLGYGVRGYSPVIPPNANLKFEFEVLELNPQR